MRLVRALVATLSALVALGAAQAQAHPLGNFTINHLTEVRVERHRALHVRYVLDIAEIPAFQIMRERGGQAAFERQAAIEAWSADEIPVILAGLHVSLDGAPIALHAVQRTATTRPGAGGLPTLYLTADFTSAPLPGSAGALVLSDQTYPKRLGWKDIVAGDQSEPTSELRAYPNALIGSPRNVTVLRATIAGTAFAAVTTNATESDPGQVPTASAARSNTLSDMLSKGTNDWWFVLLTLIAAIGLGALHAIEPGHGKTLLAVSLVGARATIGQAAILAGALTVAHTAGVVLLGVVLLLASKYIVPETIYPWITLLSGLAVAYLGARALARYLRAAAGIEHVHAHAHAHAHPHEHAHEHADWHGDHLHGHDHVHPLVGEAHPHDHGTADAAAHAHSHGIPAGSQPLQFGGVVLAAMSGGIAPCPAALVVLLTALTLHQVAYGLLIIVAFSFGLAAVLTGLGIAVVRGTSWISARPEFDRFVRYGPFVSACMIALIGAVMVGQGMAETLVRAPWLLVSGLVLLAIAGYAITPGHAHARRAHA